MKKYRVYLLVLFSIAFTQVKAQHSPLFSQYMFNGLVINPAYATGKDGLVGTLYYKKQWAGFQGAPVTTSATLQSSFKNEKYGLGLVYLNDRFGLKKQNDIAASFAYRVKIGKGLLGMGISGGLSVLKNNNAIRTTDPNDETFIHEEKTSAYPKIGLGLYYHTEKFFTGISIPQWLISNNNEQSHGVFRRTFFVYTGRHFTLSPTFKVTPSVLLKYIAGSPAQADYNVLFNYNNILSAGVSYRMYNSLVFLLQYQLSNFTIGYAYDLATGYLSSYTSGSHELMLRYNINYGVNMPSPKSF